jgi:hypothetical protein
MAKTINLKKSQKNCRKTWNVGFSSPVVGTSSIRLEMLDNGGIVALMNDTQFARQAAALRGTIPKETRERILANAFCVNCRDSVQITNITGEEPKGDVSLFATRTNPAYVGAEVTRLSPAGTMTIVAVNVGLD